MRISYFAFWTDKIIACFLLGLGIYMGWKMRKNFRLKAALFSWCSFLFLFFMVRLGLYIIYHHFFAELATQDLLEAFAWGLRFDVCAAGTLGGAFFIAFLVPVLSKRYYQVVAGAWAILWSLTLWVCVGDSIYFSFVKRHVGSELWLAIYDTDLLVSLVFSNYIWLLIGLLIMSIAIVALSVYIINKMYQEKDCYFHWKEVVSLLVAASLMFLAFRGQFGFRFKPLTVNEAYAEGNLLRGHLALNAPFCIYKSVSKKYAALPTLVKAEESLDRARRLLQGPQEKYVDATYPLLRQRHTFNVNGQGFNVVLLVLESWQYKYTDSFSGSKYGATPNIDALAKESVVFDHFYASGQRSINGNGTIMSGVAQIAGLPYFSLGLEQYHFIGLAELLGKAGYRTIFAQPSDWNSARVGLVAQITGFKEIYAQPDMTSLGNYARKGMISDYDGLMLLADKLKEGQTPFFALFFTAAMHPPFLPIYLDFTKYDFEGPDKGYLNVLNYTDWAIGQFIARLKEQGQYDHTIFILVADHTLGWGESGSFEDRFHIPLLIHVPALLQAKINATVGSQADLLPTILDMLHISAPYAAMGNSLWDKQEAHFAFTSQDGRILAWVEEDGYLEHTGQARAGGTLTRPDAERDLLGLNRAVHDLLISEHWVPQADNR